MEKRNKKNKQRGNGEGTLYFSESLNCYVGQYFDLSGKRQTMKQKKNEKTSDFKKRFNNKIASINQGTYIAKSNETCIDILKKYVEQKHLDGITSDRTYIRDLETVKQVEKTCANWVNKPVQKVTIEDIEKSKINIRSYSKNTIDKIWRFIDTIFKDSVSRKKILFNPMMSEILTKPISFKETKKVEALSISEEQLLKKILLSAPNKQYNQIIELQLLTGARIGEILALSRDCIDLENNSLTIYRTLTRDKNDKVILGKHTKTYNKNTGIDKGKRTIPMTPEVRKLIEEILSNKITNIYNLLFWDYSKNRLISDGMINSYLDRINVIDKKHTITDRLSSHRLRHTFVTRCQEKGISYSVIQALVGHVEGSSVTNDVYTTVNYEFMKQEIEKII